MSTTPAPKTPAEGSKPTPPSAVTTGTASDGKKKAQEKILSYETQLKGFEGKKGYNPFVWKRDNKWEFLVKEVELGNTSAITKVLAFPSVVSPTVKNEVLLNETIVTPAPFAPPASSSEAAKN